jgi:hypothetical protein
MTCCPVDLVPCTPRQARGRLQLKATHWKLNLGLRFASSSSSAHTCRKSAPFRAGQRLNPYPLHYRVTFASSRISYRLRLSPRLRSGDSGDLRLAPPQRANPAYHVSRFAPTKGCRMPLYTGGFHTCVGRPLKPTEPDPHPVLGLEPLSRLSSAGLRCVTSRLHYCYPCPSCSAVGPVCDSRFQRLRCA